MCHIKMSDKGWLRQYIPQPSSSVFTRFIIQVENNLSRTLKPTFKQIERARLSAFQLIMGVVS